MSSASAGAASSGGVGEAQPQTPSDAASPAGRGGPELVVVLGVSAAERQGAVALTCTSLGGTTVAVLEVDISQSVQGLIGLLSERLEALLARSSDWTQRLRLAYPDGSLLPEHVDASLTVEELVRSDAWRKAEARPREEGDTPSPAGTPTRLGRARADSRGKLETNLKRLQEAKNLPLTAKVGAPAKSPSKEQLDIPVASESGGDQGGAAPAAPSGSGAANAAAPAATAAGAGAGGGAAGAGGGAAVRPGGQRGSNADPASREAGGRVLLVSSVDGAHPGDNVIDGSEKTYWVSTGLYPQEILVELGRPSHVSGVRLSATNVRGVRILGCSEQAAVQFETLAAGEMEAAAGCLQRKELRCSEQAAPTRFVKTMILSGWHDFCSVHRISVVE